MGITYVPTGSTRRTGFAVTSLTRAASSILLQHPTVTATLTPGFPRLALLALPPRTTKPPAAAGLPGMPRGSPGSCGPDSSGSAELKGRTDDPDGEGEMEVLGLPR